MLIILKKKTGGYNMHSSIKNKNLLNAIEEYYKYYNSLNVSKDKFNKYIDSIKIRDNCIYINEFRVDNIEQNGEVIDLYGITTYCGGEISVVDVDMSDSELDFIEESSYNKIELSNVNIVDISDLKITLSSTYNINLSNNKIRDISAFCYKQYDMRNIITLDLSFNRIKDVSPLFEFEWMRSLNVSSNKIENIVSFEKLRSLEYLNISNNRIKDIKPLTNLIHLKQLDIRNNDVEDVDEILFIRNLLNVKYDKELLNSEDIDREESNIKVEKIQELIRNVDLKEKWVLLNSEERINKQNEIKHKLHEFHPLKNFELSAVAENIMDEADYVLFLVNCKYIVLANLTKYDYLPDEYSVGFVAFRDSKEMIDYIKDGNYVV